MIGAGQLYDNWSIGHALSFYEMHKVRSSVLDSKRDSGRIWYFKLKPTC